MDGAIPSSSSQDNPTLISSTSNLGEAEGNSLSPQNGSILYSALYAMCDASTTLGNLTSVLVGYGSGMTSAQEDLNKALGSIAVTTVPASADPTTTSVQEVQIVNQRAVEGTSNIQGLQTLATSQFSQLNTEAAGYAQVLSQVVAGVQGLLTAAGKLAILANLTNPPST